MKRGKRRQHTAAFKAEVALAACRGDRTLSELAQQFTIHPNLIRAWKESLMEGVAPRHTARPVSLVSRSTLLRSSRTALSS
jgi:transposase